MRVLLAGLFTFGGLFVCVGVFFHYFPDGVGPSWFTGIFFAFVTAVLIALSLVLFNQKGSGASCSDKSVEEQVADLERQGLLVSDTFQATRAFEVEEFEDEGAHCFIELADGGVLFMTGQYLYDYLETPDDPEPNRTRTFPCLQFTVRRHKTEGFVVDIACAGAALEPECVAPSFTVSDHERDLVPGDGQIIRDRTYAQVKTEWMK